MIYYKRVPPIIIFFLSGIIYSQSISKRIEGKVIAAADNLEGIHVINMTSKLATTTDKHGSFNILTTLNDTLVLSAIQLERTELVITLEILEREVLSVFMNELVNRLDEVVVRPYGFSGNLFFDVSKIKTAPVITASTLGLPNAYVKKLSKSERELYTLTNGMGPLILISLINGDIKNAKKRIEIEKKYERTERVIDFFQDSIYLKDFDLSKSAIDDFFYYCEVDPKFQEMIDSRDRLKLLEYLKSKSVIYNKNKFFQPN